MMDPSEFAIEFVTKMRGLDVVSERFKPSPRQTIALTNLLQVKLLKDGALAEEDYAVCAVITSYPEVQSIAREVAEEILLKKRIRFPDKDKQDKSNDRKKKNPDETTDPENIDEEKIKVDEDRDSKSYTIYEKQNSKNTREQVSIRYAANGANQLKRWERGADRKGTNNRLMQARLRETIQELTSSYPKETSDEQGYLLRPYDYGEDPTLIDFEETLEYILTQPKPLNYVKYEDFLVRKMREDRRAVVVLLDVSASMYGKTLLHSLACCSILLEVFRRDDVAIAFFESDTYAVKGFDEKISVKEILEELSFVNSANGTMITGSLLWAMDQFTKSKAERKFCLVISDGNFFDLDEACGLFRNLEINGVRTVVICIESLTNPSARSFEDLKRSSAEVVRIGTPEELMATAARILR